jgi:hypothetical protein
MKAVKVGNMFITDPSASPDEQMKSIDKLQFDIKFPKKKVRKDPQFKNRVVICGTTSWKKPAAIRAALKSIGISSIEYVIVGTSRGAEQIGLQLAKKFGLMIFQSHPYMSSNYIVAGKVIKLFKPTIILGFNEKPEENTSTEAYEKLAHRKDIPFKMVSK